RLGRAPLRVSEVRCRAPLSSQLRPSAKYGGCDWSLRGPPQVRCCLSANNSRTGAPLVGRNRLVAPLPAHPQSEVDWERSRRNKAIAPYGNLICQRRLRCDLTDQRQRLVVEHRLHGEPSRCRVEAMLRHKISAVGHDGIDVLHELEALVMVL